MQIGVVDYGQVIAKLGHSGNSSAPHLHIELLKNGEYVDTTLYMSPDEPRPTATGTSSKLIEWLFGREGGNEYINGDIWTIFDPIGKDNTMNLAHGMVVADYDGGPSWYPDLIPSPVRAGQTVTKEVADKVWRCK